MFLCIFLIITHAYTRDYFQYRSSSEAPPPQLNPPTSRVIIIIIIFHGERLRRVYRCEGSKAPPTRHGRYALTLIWFSFGAGGKDRRRLARGRRRPRRCWSGLSRVRTGPAQRPDSPPLSFIRATKQTAARLVSALDTIAISTTRRRVLEPIVGRLRFRRLSRVSEIGPRRRRTTDDDDLRTGHRRQSVGGVYFIFIFFLR